MIGWTKNKRFRAVVYSFLAVILSFVITCSRSDSFDQLLKAVQSATPAEQKLLVEEFIRTQNDLPLVYDSTAYFVFENHSNTTPFLTGDMTSWRPDSLPLTRIGHTDYWYCKLHFTAAARIEYKYVMNGKYLLDPLNSRMAQGGYGFNSVFWMPEYKFPEEVLFVKEYPAGRVDTLEFRSRLLRNRRRIFVYRYPQAKSDAPLIIFHDGGDYLRFARAHIILNNLIATGKIPAVNALLIDPVDRNKEYMLNDDYLKMVFRELLPQMQSRFDLAKRAPLYMGGASLGGAISIYALKNYADRLRGVFSQSGALWVENGRLLRMLEDMPQIKPKIYLDFGQFEHQHPWHFGAEKILRQKKSRFRIHIWPEGHNWGNWQAHLSQVLNYLLKEQKDDRRRNSRED